VTRESPFCTFPPYISILDEKSRVQAHYGSPAHCNRRLGQKGCLYMHKVWTLTVIFLVALFAFGQGDSATPSQVPAFHSAPPAKGTIVPPILPKDALWGPAFQFPYQSHAYELASKVSSVIYQQPCYCYCDRMGHSSLHSCFESTHGAECGTCLQELYYTYKQSRMRKTPAQIRQGIVRGEWKQINLESAASIN
jgi:hypothetical protein